MLFFIMFSKSDDTCIVDSCSITSAAQSIVFAQWFLIVTIYITIINQNAAGIKGKKVIA
jgi:hypothetical protein